jgi:fructose-1,6-bisphosphatase/inositol monophosphatase family enzyme
MDTLTLARWKASTARLADAMREAARTELLRARASGDFSRVARPVAVGAGDLTYGIDAPTEEVLTRWLLEQARHGPLSLLTEDAGWRHFGPGPAGPGELPGFDHGGPRIVVDPIDGTRNLMTDLRSAWSVIALCGPGKGEPRQSDVVHGLLSEIPTSRAGSWLRLCADKGGACEFEEFALHSGQSARAPRTLRADADDRVDHGYFPFFKYMADMRVMIGEVETRFLARLEQHERADVRNCYDDQYISNAGQLVCLITGQYRMIAELRAHLAERRGRATLTTKPYDIAGALLCAEAAGCVITDALGAPLDFPLDARTPVSFVGWHNSATQRRLRPHLDAALGGSSGA